MIDNKGLFTLEWVKGTGEPGHIPKQALFGGKTSRYRGGAHDSPTADQGGKKCHLRVLTQGLDAHIMATENYELMMMNLFILLL